MKKRVLILMGGKSSEHEVSLASGRQVVANLDEKKYDLLPIIIQKDGQKWLSTTKEKLLKIDTTIKENPSSGIVKLDYNNNFDIQKSNLNKNTVAFIALHGKYGEDGTIQGLLELMGIKYTGSGVLASALGMNKLKFRNLLENSGIKVPKFVVVGKDYKLKEVTSKLKFPMFVKPNEGGSSIGTAIAGNEPELKNAIHDALNFDEVVLVDELLKGKEFTCAVLGNDNPQALPVIEIRPLKAEYFDYKSKYIEYGSEEIVPAPISNSIQNMIQNIAVKVYKEIGCRGFGRIDFMLVGKNLYVLEINTIPGLTPTSLLPKAAKAAGISFPQLLEKILNFAK